MRILWTFLPLALWAAPPQTVLVSSGQTLYRSYCASCHGADGKGGGPAAQALVMRPSNLRRLSIQNGGKFPVYRVVKMLGGADEIVAHGGKQMPVWGPAFREKAPKDQEMADRVRNLVAFLESIQERPSK
ncbi:MAG: cytochrome c [Bryobacterales bacterium]|nr:cytochrome c [Bryobacterales bacterium]